MVKSSCRHRWAVEETGFFSGLSTKPFIRLRGRWLQQAGFQPGSYVVIEVVRRRIEDYGTTEPRGEQWHMSMRAPAVPPTTN
jgi:hypothetical protein